MRIEEFIHRNSLHDSYIIGAEYISHNGMLNIRLVQLFSELSIDNETQIDVEPTDQVELEIVLFGVEYISYDISIFKDFEIYSIDNGIIG